MVFLIVLLSPFGPIAVTSIIFWLLPIVVVVEKSPLPDGVITSSEESVITATTASLDVFPEIVTILLFVTSSSLGVLSVKKIEEIGVGVIFFIGIIFVLDGGGVFVA